MPLSSLFSRKSSSNNHRVPATASDPTVNNVGTAASSSTSPPTRTKSEQSRLSLGGLLRFPSRSNRSTVSLPTHSLQSNSISKTTLSTPGFANVDNIPTLGSSDIDANKITVHAVTTDEQEGVPPLKGDADYTGMPKSESELCVFHDLSTIGKAVGDRLSDTSTYDQYPDKEKELKERERSGGALPEEIVGPITANPKVTISNCGEAAPSNGESASSANSSRQLVLVGNIAEVTSAGSGLATNPRGQIVKSDSSAVPDSILLPLDLSGTIEASITHTSDENNAIKPLQRRTTLRNQENRMIDVSRRLWETAFSHLEDSDKEILRIQVDSLQTTTDHDSGAILVTIDALVHSVEERRTEIHRRRGGILTFSWKGRVFNLTSLMDNILSWAERFKAIGDIIVQYDPGHMALPWAAARFLLQTMTEDRANMAAISLTIERVTNITTLSAIYTGMYLDNRILSPVCFNRLESSLIKLHGHILSILARSVRYLKSNRSIVRSLFDYDTFEDKLRDIDHCLQDLRNDIDIAEKEVLNLNHQWQQDTYSALKTLLHGLGHSLEKLERSAEALEKDLQEKKRNDLLTWISACPYKRHHRGVLGGQTMMDNTGQWLFETDDYIDWIKKRESSILWLNGNPGVGKSYLTHAAIELQLQESWKNTMAYFYCSRRDNDKTRTDPEAIIRALLKALLIESGIDPERIFIGTRYKQRTDHGELDLKEAQTYLIDLLKQPECDKSLIFLDALDEVPKKDRLPLITILGDIVVATPTKIWVASRPELDIQRGLMIQISKKVNRLDLVKDVAFEKRNMEEVSAYIEREINTRIESGELLDGDVDDDTKQLIIANLIQKGDGMYLWVHLQILSLCDLTHPDNLQQQLQNLPQGLEGTYRVIYDEIKTATYSSDRQNAIHVLKWLCATTPLKFSELAQLVQHTNSAFNVNAPLMKDIDYLRKICRNLVAIDSQQQEVRLAHLSVREFLEGECVGDFGSKDVPHEMAVKVCFHHILRTPSLPSLMPYIVLHWTRHYRLAIDASCQESRVEIVRLSLDFLQQGHQKWLDKLSGSDEDLNGNIDPLFTIARHNLHELCENVISNPTLFNIKPENRTTTKQTPLHLAVKFEHIEIVNSLITFGTSAGVIDINGQDQDGRTPLALAINRGNHILIELLLTCSEIDLNIADEIGGYSPLVRAAWLGDENTVNMLLSVSATDAGQRRLNLNSSDNAGRTALHWAVLRRKPGIIRLLAEAGADVNTQDEIFKSSPLCSWSREFRDLFLKADDAESELQRGIAIAPLEESLEIGRQLCQLPEIDANLPDQKLNPIGHILCCLPIIENDLLRKMHLNAMEAILSAKSFDINYFPPPQNVTPVVDAILCEDDDILKLLLNHVPMNGAPHLDINALSFLGAPFTALSLAIRNNNSSALELLLNSRYCPEIDFKTPYMGLSDKTCLQYAILDHESEMASMLVHAEWLANYPRELELKGMDENWDDPGLFEAAQESHAAVLRFCNPNVDSFLRRRNDNGRTIQLQEYKEASDLVMNVFNTALKAANDVDIEGQQQLLALDINTRDKLGYTALHYATDWRTMSRESVSTEDIKKVVRRLLATPGIDVNIFGGGTGTTPLARARASTEVDSEIFDMLLAVDGIDVNAASGLGREPICYRLDKVPLSPEYTRRWMALVADKRTNLNVQIVDASPLLGYSARDPDDLNLLRALLAESGRLKPNLQSTATGYTALSEAVVNLNYTAVNLLLNHPGVDIDCPDHSWDTPLTIATRIGDARIVKALLRKKPNLTWRNYRGLTPMEIAVEAGHIKIVELLNDAIDGTTGEGSDLESNCDSSTVDLESSDSDLDDYN